MTTGHGQGRVCLRDEALPGFPEMWQQTRCVKANDTVLLCSHVWVWTLTRVAEGHILRAFKSRGKEEMERETEKEREGVTGQGR